QSNRKGVMNDKHCAKSVGFTPSVMAGFALAILGVGIIIGALAGVPASLEKQFTRRCSDAILTERAEFSSHISSQLEFLGRQLHDRADLENKRFGDLDFAVASLGERIDSLPKCEDIDRLDGDFSNALADSLLDLDLNLECSL